MLEVEELKTLHKEEKSESNGRLRKEMNELDLEVQEFRVRVNDLQSENGSKDTIIEKMRQEMNRTVKLDGNLSSVFNMRC